MHVAGLAKLSAVSDADLQTVMHSPFYIHRWHWRQDRPTSSCTLDKMTDMHNVHLRCSWSTNIMQHCVHVCSSDKTNFPSGLPNCWCSEAEAAGQAYVHHKRSNVSDAQ